MTEPTLALQGAVYTALKNHTDAGAAVFDVLTPDSWPRVQIGGGDAVPDDSMCVDGFTVTMQIDVWSKANGYLECKTIAGQVHTILHKKPLAVSGFNLVDLYSDGAVHSRDGQISRARIQITAQLEVT